MQDGKIYKKIGQKTVELVHCAQNRAVAAQDERLKIKGWISPPFSYSSSSHS